MDPVHAEVSLAGEHPTVGIGSDRFAKQNARQAQTPESFHVTDERGDSNKAEKNAVAHLRQQEEQYRLLFETNPSPMWVYDTETLRFLAVNQAAIERYGYSREEFLSLKLSDIRPNEDVAMLSQSVSESTAPAHPGSEWRHRRKDGSELLVEVYSSPLLFEGKPARMATAIDVTERKHAEERLQEQADMLNRAHDAIIVRNFNDRRIVFWNRGAERLYGWSAEEAIGQQIDSLILSDPGQLESISQVLLSTGEFRGELKEITKERRELTAEVWSTLVRNSDGSPRSVLSINNDITAQKKLETQLLRAQRLESIGTLASGVAHDLNNILTPILVCTEVLRQHPSLEDASSAISLIEESARRGAGIVKQVLTFARGIEGERVLINPGHLIDEIIDIARKTFPKSIDISGSYPEESWSIEGDPTQLHQVLLNLSVNARDAMRDGGQLTVAAENFQVDDHYASMTADAKTGPYVLFQVSDTGTGMPRAMIEKIFDPFFTTKDLGKGTGLGLSTATGIVKSHGGFISVYSEIGKGSTFKVFIPARISETISDKSKIPAELLRGNGETILVADDEPAILRTLKMILEKRNYRVIAANDGPEALGLFAQETEPIGVVLTDISMPFMDGVSVIRAIKKMKPGTRFIASTGQGEETRVTELKRLGVETFLTKPYDSERLLKTLRDTLA